jgi:hypothetical protein
MEPAASSFCAIELITLKRNADNRHSAFIFSQYLISKIKDKIGYKELHGAIINLIINLMQADSLGNRLFIKGAVNLFSWRKGLNGLVFVYEFVYRVFIHQERQSN